MEFTRHFALIATASLVTLAGFTGFFGFVSIARAESSNNLSKYEEEWAQAQQDYYLQLKKLPAPRDPEKVRALKEEFLAPKRKALEQAYDRHAKSLGVGGSDPKGSKSATNAGPDAGKGSEPEMKLDGSSVKKEVRYTKKGAPVDMTADESPDAGGPEILAPTTSEATGEIAYPKKKKAAEKKPAQGLRKSAP